ncbi:MAG TPA: hypothetical protein VJI96_04955 [Candidatus Andersenbacteria bacterium]|nr:hypothetical protein [Candidatus Andersenbacteria bacterium]
MALEASHVRIALAVQDKLSITDRGAYVCGSIYPDSRYITKIDRFLTHPEDYRKDPMFKKSDFYKGWLVHLLTDDIQYKATKEALPKVCEGVEGQGSDVWVRRTAIKIIQDMADAKSFDVRSVLPYLDQAFTPNGEDETLIKKYNNLFVDMYKSTDNLSLESYAIFWRALGIDSDTEKRLITQTETYVTDHDIASKAAELYEAVVRRLSEELPTV